MTRAKTLIVLFVMAVVSVAAFYYFYQNGLGLSYNDARSHLDIGRRVVEGLKPGLAQLGSVWLPLNHFLMVPLVWQDTLWHTGLAGAIWSMLAYVGTCLFILLYLRRLGVGWIGGLIGMLIFATNLNILYLQSTAMTELLLLFTMLAGCYYLLRYFQEKNVLDLIKTAFWIMLSTLVRYDGWFLVGVVSILLIILNLKRRDYREIEGTTVLFTTLAYAGILAWFGWNQLIFHDALYFMLGPFSAHAQQDAMVESGALPTKFNLLLSLKVYLYALFYNSYTYPAVVALIGLVWLLRDKALARSTKLGVLSLLSPFGFNVLALFLGFSVVYIPGLIGGTWFNVRYGVMLMPTIGILVGYLVDRARHYRPLIIFSLAFVLVFSFISYDAVTIDDARVGSSQKNVTEVSNYLHDNGGKNNDLILISAASHDAIIFSSGLPMKRFIHEGTGDYWLAATSNPDLWARYIVMRTYDDGDLTWRLVKNTPGFSHYRKVASYPFADVYELNGELPAKLGASNATGQ